MKNLLATMLFSLVLSPVSAQDLPPKDVPQQVLDAFRSKHKEATAVDWEKKGASFEVEYKEGTQDHKILYNKDGVERYHKEDIATADLPADISGSLNAKYPNYSATEAEKLSEKGKVTYSVDIKTVSGEKREVHLNEKGKIVLDRLD